VLVFRFSVARPWVAFRLSVQTDWVRFRVQSSVWAVFRVGVKLPWTVFRTGISGFRSFRVGIKHDLELQKLHTVLLPLDHAVQISYPVSTTEALTLKVYTLTGEAILTGTYADHYPTWLFRSLLQSRLQDTLADEFVVVNNEALLFLEQLRREGINDYNLDEYELALAVNYTALDNWRIGEYQACNALYHWLYEHVITRP
jgi:hypothetical protein